MQTAEHPENVAALDDQFASSPPKVSREDVWPLDTLGAGKAQGNTAKDSQGNSTCDGKISKPPNSAIGSGNCNSGKVLHGDS